MTNEHIGLYGVPSLYPTPPILVDRLIDRMNVQPGDVILEPSVGTRNISKRLHERFPTNSIWVIEKHPLLRAYAIYAGEAVVGHDIFDFNVQVDWVIQNPPFSNNYQDIDHFRKAWALARKGVVSLLHEYSGFTPSHSPRYKPNQFQQWFLAQGCQREMLPPNSFATADKPSNVSVCMVWGEKIQ